MPTPILVTCALGNVGRHVTAQLVAAGVPVRAGDLDAAAVARRFGPAVEPVVFDFTRPATWRRAVTGVGTMLVVRPPQVADVRRDLLPALAAAAGAGVRHMVLLSVQGADRNRLVPHARIESWLRGSAVGWTFVRPAFFMENLSGTHAADIRDHDRISVPAGQGRTSFVAVSDVAAVCTAALRDPRAHDGRCWTPTGPSALDYEQVAAILTDVLGRTIRYDRPGVWRYARQAHRDLGMPWGMVAVTVALYSAARFGLADGITGDVQQVTGSPPRAFAEWAREHRSSWEHA